MQSYMMGENKGILTNSKRWMS
jgi:hypothetical protein